MASLPAVPSARLAVGLAQGLVLYLLYQAAKAKAWPATEGLVFAPLLLIACFVPLILLNGLGNMRRRTLLAWAGAATVLLAGLAVHDVARLAENGDSSLWTLFGGRSELRIWPSTVLTFFAAAALFIAQSLIVAGDAERRIVAGYPRYFDTAWKHGVQLALSGVFIGLFWALLVLGAALFKLIDIDFFDKLIQHKWFYFPATTLAFACALHVTDARAGIVRGMRVLVHTLLSWLLPLMALFVAGFLATLPFTGLAPLWGTRFATKLLLTTAVALIVLINAAHQDGQEEHAPPRVLRLAGSLAALMLVPLVAIAAYALGLRVAQHGWTTDRIIATACVVVAACYALGYAWAAIRPGRWLERIEICNVAAAFVVLGVLLALFTPIADPARLSVGSQVARLESGVVPPEKFDFAYLRFDGARYGRAALERLKAAETGAQAADIRRRAQAALELKNRWERERIVLTPQELAANITVYPAGRVLPESFLKQNWGALARWTLPSCLVEASHKCEAFLLDLDGDGREEAVFLDPPTLMVVMAEDGHGAWRRAGQFDGPVHCSAVRDALRAGKYETAAPTWRDLQVSGLRLRFTQPMDAAKCP
ncbi:MAG TPA: DUF4153 domain-containing protein [Stellaceae bacterium]